MKANVAAFATTALLSTLLANYFSQDFTTAESSLGRHYNYKERAFLSEIGNKGIEDYVLFFGPSTTEYNILPSEFDAAFKEKGVFIDSFNLGLSGAGGHEVDYRIRNTIEGLLEERLALPALVIIDLTLPLHHRILELISKIFLAERNLSLVLCNSVS